jgi:hypothetical protein
MQRPSPTLVRQGAIFAAQLILGWVGTRLLDQTLTPGIAHDGGIIVLLLVIVIAGAWAIVETGKGIGRTTPPQTFGAHIKDREVRISELTLDSSVVGDRTFENCHIYGPAVVLFRGARTVIERNHWDGAGGRPQDLMLEVPDNHRPIGSVLFLDCVFRECWFHRATFAGTHKEIELLKNNTTVITGVPMQPPPRQAP